MLTPRSKPTATRMKSVAPARNQVAIIQPSSCQTVAKRSQSPASRHSAQFSTSSRISRRSPGGAHTTVASGGAGIWLVGGIGGPVASPLMSGVP